MQPINNLSNLRASTYQTGNKTMETNETFEILGELVEYTAQSIQQRKTVMFTYTIKGQVNYIEAETDEGYDTIGIDETIDIDEMSAQKAKDIFFEKNPQYDDFFGSMKTCDAETHGGKCATFIDRTDAGRTIDVELVCGF